MLSYQHIYHAGNVVDCQKHMILSALLARLRDDHPALTYLDTHSGRGLYDLAAPEAQKIQEYRDGIDRIWPLSDWPVATATYQKLLEGLNPDGVVRFYPGSAYLAASQLRYYDSALLYELHPQEHEILAYQVQRFGNVMLYMDDGWAALATLPSIENKGLILIDPSYEMKDEYTAMAGRVAKALRRWRDGTIMIWYPLLPAARHVAMLDELRHSGIKNIMRNEIVVKDNDGAGLYGTGVLVINPPVNFIDTVDEIGSFLASAIGIGQKNDWLVAP